MSEKEKINQLKYMCETFGCRDKRVEEGFVQGLFYAVNLLEHGKEYADKKMDWDHIGREDDRYVSKEEEKGCSSC